MVQPGVAYVDLLACLAVSSAVDKFTYSIQKGEEIEKHDRGHNHEVELPDELCFGSVINSWETLQILGRDHCLRQLAAHCLLVIRRSLDWFVLHSGFACLRPLSNTIWWIYYLVEDEGKILN